MVCYLGLMLKEGDVDESNWDDRRDHVNNTMWDNNCNCYDSAC